jgi:hypothetical protein
VTDDDGGTGTASLAVTVNDVAPSVALGPNVTNTQGAPFQGNGSFTDPGTETWTATVDYGDGSGPQPLVLNPDKTFRLDHTYTNLGVYPVTVAVKDSAGQVGTHALSVTVAAPSVPPGNLTPPTVVMLQRVGIHEHLTHLVLTFSEALDPATAQNLSNYQIIDPGPDGRFGTRDDRTVAVLSAVYDAALHTVTLSPVTRLDWHKFYGVRVMASAPSGIANPSGVRLDGDGSGHAGIDYGAVLHHYGAVPGRTLSPASAASPKPAKQVHTKTHDPFHLYRSRRLP